ncbi:hypothetical protein HPP92_020924 [Vanilla planifolia]|uniref:Uncharacterized protein n=1 Tax=Vanilla planifolia TaxID=51239 RepID=A0A835Q0K9_VANPL|nr:hypothetical protein HPP92_020924 [Vanilla planifolia]
MKFFISGAVFASTEEKRTPLQKIGVIVLPLSLPFSLSLSLCLFLFLSLFPSPSLVLCALWFFLEHANPAHHGAHIIPRARGGFFFFHFFVSRFLVVGFHESLIEVFCYTCSYLFLS